MLATFIAKVEGLVQVTFFGAPPQTPSCFAPPIKIHGSATDHSIFILFAISQCFIFAPSVVLIRLKEARLFMLSYLSNYLLTFVLRVRQRKEENLQQ